MVDMPDSILMAYADGELAAESCKAVEAALAADPVARERLAAFKGTSRDRLEPLFDPLIEERVPERLRDLVLGLSMGLNGAPPRAPTRGAAVLGLLRSLLAPPTMTWARVALVLLLGMGVGWALSRAPVGTEPTGTHAGLLKGVGVASGQLMHALEGTPSGTLVSLRGDTAGTALSFEAKLTFASQDGRYCRHYELSDPGGSRYAGLACRSAEGQWQIEVYARAPGKADPSKGRIVPAQGNAGPVAAAVMDMISGVSLDGQQELDLIRRGWRTGS